MAIVFAGLLTLSVLLFFVGVWTAASGRDPVEARLAEYGVSAELAETEPAKGGARRAWPGLNRLLNGFGLGEKLATQLSRAGLPLTAAEFALVVSSAVFLGLLAGLLRRDLLSGVILAAVLGALPIAFLQLRKGKRLADFTAQLPDVLTLLIGALRAGQGLAQALASVGQQVPEPSASEFGRVLREVNLGLSIQQALNNMTERLASDDLDLVVTAVGVQYELGGDLAVTLGTIAETVRDRIRMKREIRALTAQQRFTGYVLGFLPIGLGLAIYLLNPGYISKLFQPGLIRAAPAAALLLQLIGFLIIRKIVDIEV